MGDPDREDRASAPTVAGRGSAPTGRPTAVDRPGGARPSAPTDPDPEPSSGPADPAASAFDPPADRFAERDELGRGGMGRVVEAHDRALDRPVAVKYMLSDDEAALARFEREARITARLEHPGIVAVHDAGRTADGTPYYVMRRVDGEPLAEVVARRSASERRTLVPNVLAAADAIAYAHARGVIHRDLKPSNILLGAFGETLVIDWGIARSVDAELELPESRPSEPALTRVGTVAGTPGFMAPEQARGEAIDARVDVYALGTTLFYVLAGELPYTASGATEMIDLAGAGRAPEWHRLPADTPPELRAIVAKAMAARREERYRDAGELAADLRAYVTGQLVGAHQYGRLQRLRRFVRRHRAAVAVALVAAVVIVSGGVVSVHRIVQERDSAEAATALAEQQRREATDGRDLLLVQHAEQLAAVDPVAAIAVLRRLPVDSRQWQRAAFVAESAASRGIPRGLAVPTGSARLTLAPGSRRGAHIAFMGGTVLIFEVSSLESFSLAVPRTMANGHWLDDRFLVLYGTEAELTVIDADQRTVRSAMVPRRIESVVSDGRGGAWVLDSGGTVFTFDDGELGRSVASAVTSLVGGSARGDALVVRAGRLELWRNDQKFPLADTAGIAVMGEGRVAAHLGDRICTWDVAATPRAEPCATLERTYGIVGVTSKRVFVAREGHVEALLRDGRHYRLAEHARTYFRLVSGGVLSTERGLSMYDRWGHLQIASREASFRQIVQSDDERWLVGLTTNGEILCWDLARLRPQRLTTKAGTLVGMSEERLYLRSNLGFDIYEMSTQTQTALEDVVLESFSEPSGTWVIFIDARRSEFLLHVPTNRRVSAQPGETFGVFDGRAFSMRHGEVAWVAPGGQRTPFARLPGATTIYVGPHHVLGILDGKLCRALHGSDARDCTSQVDAKEIRAAAVAQDGTTIVLALVRGERRLLRWIGTGPLEEILPGVALDFLIWANGEPLAVGPRSMVWAARSDPRPIPIPSVASLSAGPNGRLIGTTPTRIPIVIDAASGAWYPLQADEVPDGQVPLARGTTVAVATGRRVQLFELATPTEPVALRAWLASVTNALPVEDSAVVSWPRGPRVTAP